MKILGIESSCDDSSIALVENGKKILFNYISSQFEIHQPFQGIVPELAARKHLENFPYLVSQTLKKNSVFSNFQGIAVTNKPGLSGSLLMGVSLAKSLALIFDKPVIGINHLKAHFYSLIMNTTIKFPFLGLLISGGHTLLALVKSPLQIKILGSTLDDACGESLDKIAKYYDLPIPGGPNIEKIAKIGNENFFHFPLPCMSQHKNNSFPTFSFSFSGLKTAVIHHKDKYLNPNFKSKSFKINHLAASLQKTVSLYLYKQVKRAAELYEINQIGICGGVAANNYLRQFFLADKSLKFYFPQISLCTDNAAMVAGLAYEYFSRKKINQFRDLTISPKNFKKNPLI